MISFAVFGCGLSLLRVWVLATLLMVFCSFAFAFAFHAVRGMYLHAERLLAKAGRQSARGGVSPIRSEAEDERSEGLHKRERGRLLGNPLRCARAEPSAKVWFPYSCASAHMTFRVALRQEQAAVGVAEDADAAADREERHSSPAKFVSKRTD
jgi:hypothetical protein